MFNGLRDRGLLLIHSCKSPIRTCITLPYSLVTLPPRVLRPLNPVFRSALGRIQTILVVSELQSPMLLDSQSPYCDLPVASRHPFSKVTGANLPSPLTRLHRHALAFVWGTCVDPHGHSSPFTGSRNLPGYITPSLASP